MSCLLMRAMVYLMTITSVDAAGNSLNFHVVVMSFLRLGAIVGVLIGVIVALVAVIKCVKKPKICPQCGKELKMKARFCNGCGAVAPKW